MIFAKTTKAATFIVAIQLLVVIANHQVAADENVFWKAWAVIKNRAIQMSNMLSRPAKHTLHCFYLSTSYFGKVIDALFVNVVKAQNVKFYFASRQKPNYTTVTIINNTFSMDGVDFNPHRQTVLISHGFMSSGKFKWVEEMKDAFLLYDDVNVIVVDWQEGSNTWNYMAAATSTKIVGAEVATLFAHIRDDITKRNFDLDKLGKMHFVGHSLGAHIVARAAHLIKKSYNGTSAKKPWIANRITGLDPAQPCFITADEDLKLDEKDADFVDVIHTNARHVLLMGLGLRPRIGGGRAFSFAIGIGGRDVTMAAKVGTIDFYPNGGQFQPGCTDIDPITIGSYTGSVMKMKDATICSHGRAYLLFTESIVAAVAGNCSFTSHLWTRGYDENVDELILKTCNNGDCPQLGINSINTLPHTKGIYFTATGHNAPYCLIQESDRVLIDKQLQSDSRLASGIKNIIG